MFALKLFVKSVVDLLELAKIHRKRKRKEPLKNAASRGVHLGRPLLWFTLSLRRRVLSGLSLATLSTHAPTTPGWGWHFICRLDNWSPAPRLAIRERPPQRCHRPHRSYKILGQGRNSTLYSPKGCCLLVDHVTKTQMHRRINNNTMWWCSVFDKEGNRYHLSIIICSEIGWGCGASVMEAATAKVSW